ncbi:PKD domain-containing protein [Streptacidiphilus anmyonensis]|uniref:PKD domain-containing protein n=1 Tax=Streptacidiphilus anmyonensis TaxID=405782 RepID=UPI0005AB5807|nr:PKD domain-containing protein [Streptacidiphilus anmyonensis]
MTFRSLAALTVLAVTAGPALVAAPAVADTTSTPPALYVAGFGNCTDGPTRTAGQPYCTVQAAVDAAQPGQSVLISPSFTAQGPVTVTHSGAPGAPITISVMGPAYNHATVKSTGGQPAFTFSGVHDVVLNNVWVTSDADAVAIDASSDITLLDDHLIDNATQSTPASAAVSVTGKSSVISVSRNTLHSIAGGAVTVGPGASGVSVTSNLVLGDGANGITATDAGSTMITGNTVYGACPDQIQLAGASTDSVVENNIVTYPTSAASCAIPGGDGARVSVSAGSATGIVLDYNIVNPLSGQSPYTWAGTTHADPASLRAAAGQGAHDLLTDPLLAPGGTPQEGSPAIDSGDYQANGATGLDLNGNYRVDDLLAPNTGTSPGYLDRGAIELQDPYRLTGLTADRTSGDFPLPVTFAATESNPWGASASYTWNFGDGTPPLTTSTPTTTHTYDTAPAAGQSYTATVSVKTADGISTPSQQLTGIVPIDPGPLAPSFDVTRVGDAFSLSIHVDTTASKDPLPITRRTVSFGDGTPTVDITGTGAADHTYAKGGGYNLTLTETDTAGRTIAYGDYIAVGELAVPRFDLMARDGSGDLWRYQGTGLASSPYHPRTLVGPGWSGYSLLTLPAGYSAVNGGVMYARDTTGELWQVSIGTSATPSTYRLRVGGGWNTYNTIVGAGGLDPISRVPNNGPVNADLVARDASGVLWLYQGTGNSNALFKPRVRIGGGWNTYNTIVGVGDITNDAWSDLVARDASGVLWLYQGTGNPSAPFKPRVRIGGGWNTYNTIVGARDLNNDGLSDLVARDASGVLWLYQGTGNPSAPFKPRVRIGGGWNTYNTIEG